MSPDNRLLTYVAERYGTPAYVYDLADIRRACGELVSVLPEGSRLCYSLKANPLPPIVRELVAAGCTAEVCSLRELATAQQAGAGGRVLYTGPAKRPAEVEGALRAGVRLFSAESATDLRRLGAAARAHHVEVQALLRLNPDVAARRGGLAMGGKPSQFGVDVAAVCADPGQFAEPGVRLLGFQIFAGSNAPDLTTLYSWLRLAVDAAAVAAAALDLSPELLDLGGGFGHPFAQPGLRPDLSGFGDEVIRLLTQAQPPGAALPVLMFEAGRFLVAGSGSLLLRVIEVKRSKGEDFVIVDGGVNVLGGMSGLRRIAPMVTAVTLDDQSPDGTHPAGRTRLVGPLCTPLDVLSNDLACPPRLAEGDLLRVPNVGAYGPTASLLAFLGRDCPVELTVDSGRIRDVAQLRYDYALLKMKTYSEQPADTLMP